MKNIIVNPSGDPESLFCAILQSQYNLIIASLETAIRIPSQALQLIKSVLQTLEYVAFVYVDLTLTQIEKSIYSMFDLGNVGLENARRNFCRIAYACKVLTDYLFGSGSPLLSLGYTTADLSEMSSNYTKFEEIVCNKSFKGLLNEFKTSILGDISILLDELENKIENDWLKLNDAIAEYNDLLDEYNVYDWLNKLNDFANCSFAACNFLATSENAQEDAADKLKLVNEGGAWILDPNIYAKLLVKKENFQVRIDKLRELNTSCENNDPNPNNGVSPDDIA